MERKKVSKIFNIFYTVLFLILIILSVAPIYQGKAEFEFNGEPIADNLTAAVVLVVIYFFMWLFMVFITQIVLAIREKNKQ